VGDGTSRRWWNVRTPERYVHLIEEGSPVEAAGESLDGDAKRREALELSLRTRAGVPLSALPPISENPGLDGLIECQSDRWVLTLRGRLLANEVSLRLRV
jgi:oxygen-independent coproporphyrinogen-3 oxidase